ncbi:MAG: SRPBCC family protein [Chloroflexi bacterium]|nr:SRPBCC family protein [Chloroflexota bacterium]
MSRRLGQPADRIGCVRRLTLEDGAVIREELLAFSDEERSCTYSILESPLPLENYISTLRLLPVTNGDRTFSQWSSEFDTAPENEAEFCGLFADGVYQGGFDNLKNPA